MLTYFDQFFALHSLAGASEKERKYDKIDKIRAKI